MNIFTKSESLEEALFYINKVATEGWSRARLEHEIDARLFLKQGAAITNFDKTLPIPQIESAKELLKKEYDLSFRYFSPTCYFITSHNADTSS